MLDRFKYLTGRIVAKAVATFELKLECEELLIAVCADFYIIFIWKTLLSQSNLKNAFKLC